MSRYTTISVTAEVDVDDVIRELDDEDLVEELQNRGYTCVKGNFDFEAALTKEEIDLLIAHIDIRALPLDWEWKRIRDKLMTMDYTK
jgi:sulfur transfer complex TusBCD TusB component (DsrH family)